MNKTAEGILALADGLTKDARRMAMTERCLDDALIVLCAKDGVNHQTVVYDDDDIVPRTNDVLNMAYRLRDENDKLRAEIEELKHGDKKPWYKRLFHC